MSLESLKKKLALRNKIFGNDLSPKISVTLDIKMPELANRLSEKIPQRNLAKENNDLAQKISQKLRERPLETKDIIQPYAGGA